MDTLSKPEQELASLLASGLKPSLSDLGGVDALNPFIDQIRRSRFVDEFVCAAANEVRTGGAASNEVSTFVVHLVEGLTDEFALPIVVDALDGADWINSTCAEKCAAWFRVLTLERSASAIARAFALDGAFRIGAGDAATRYDLYGVLLRIKADDDPIFLSRALKVLGVAYANDRLPAIFDQIVALSHTEAVQGEAAFEIGLAKLTAAFEAKDHSDAQLAFHESAFWFQKADESAQVSPEAKLYAHCLSALSSFSESKNVATIMNLTEVVGRCSVALAAWHYDESDPNWLGCRRFQTTCWESLAFQLRISAEALDRDFWAEPVIVIEQHVLPIYMASRTVFKRTAEGGLEAVILPRIEASLATERVRSRALLHWLSTNVEHEWREPAEGLSRGVLALLESGGDPNPKQAATQGPTVAALVNNSAIPDQAKRRIAQVLEDSRSLQLDNIKANECAVVEQCIEAIEDHPDYRLNPDARGLFGSILLWTVLFLSNRLDATIQNNPALTYLFYDGSGVRPKEEDLQKDYYQVMRQSMLGASVEISDVGGGRADVHFKRGPDYIVCEVKREEKDASFKNLRAAYLEQSVSYQVTSYRLGFVLVLDQTEAGAGMPTHLSDLVRVETFVRNGESVPRRSVVIKVPGRKVRPSDLTRSAKPSRLKKAA